MNNTTTNSSTGKKSSDPEAARARIASAFVVPIGSAFVAHKASFSGTNLKLNPLTQETLIVRSQA